MKSSAVPMKTKRSALTQEVKRRMRNCHENLPKDELADVLSKFSQKMRNSGYNQTFREQVINAGVIAHRGDVNMDKEGEKKLFRSRNMKYKIDVNKSSLLF